MQRHRTIVVLAVTAAVLLAAAPASRAEDFSPTFSISPPPAWVKQDAGELKPPTRGLDESEVCILADYQVNVATGEKYMRFVDRLNTADGVQNGSTITADYDPAYQTIVFHHISVIRGGVSSSRLSKGAFNFLRRETDLEWSMLDGTVTASSLLKDIRPGDTIDYAYTLRGRNPVLGGRYVDYFSYGWGIPIGRERIRILSPSSRALRHQAVGGKAEPRVTRAGSTTEYEWDFTDLAPVLTEDGTPSWYVSYPWIDVSEFPDWQAVGAWALELYPSATLPPGLEALAADWSRASDTPAARLEAALDYVQREIRYVGLELGEGSHKPRSPKTVFEQRFGDCKDKSYMLCTLLGRMGIEAHPVLVDTYSRELVGSLLPSPYAFNHVIVAATVGDRRVYADPTDSYQRGAVLERFIPDYGYGLVIAKGQTGLTHFTGWQGKPADIEMTETFTPAGQDEAAGLEVTTVAMGSAADDLRAHFDYYQTGEIEKQYLNYYAASYPKVESAGTIEVQDNEKENVFTVVEHYRVPDFWVLMEDKRNYEAKFFAHTLYDEIPIPRTKIRTSPIEISHPRTVRERIVVNLPEPWPDMDEKRTISTAGFELKIDCTSKGALAVLDYQYTSLVDEIPVSDVPAYNQAVKDIDAELGYHLTWQAENALETAGPLDSSVVMIMVLCALLFAVAGFGMYKLAVRPAAALSPAGGALTGGPSPIPVPMEIGGLLLAFAALLALIIAFSAYNLWSMRSYFSVGNWYDMTNPSGAIYDSLWSPYFLFVIATNIAVIAFAAVQLILFFQRRRRFMAFTIALFILLGAIWAAGKIFMSALETSSPETGSWLTRELAVTVFSWVLAFPYIIDSSRMKRTFLR